MAKATHSTPSDGTFSAEGALAWNADHPITLGDDENFVTDAQLAAIAAIGTKGQVIIDFGSIPKEAAEFTVSSAGCTPTSIVTASMAYEDTTDNFADEIEMSKIVASAGQPSAGSFKLLVTAFDGCIAGTFKVNYAY